jgi:hypothetical protein
MTDGKQYVMQVVCHAFLKACWLSGTPGINPSVIPAVRHASSHASMNA